MKRENLSVFITFLVFTGLILAIAWPFKHAIIVALIISGVFYPLMNIFHKKFGLSEQVASVAICLIATLGIFAPFSYLIYKISQELIVFSQYVTVENITQSTQLLEKFYQGDGIIASNIRKFLSYLGIAESYAELESAIIEIAKNAAGAVFNVLNSLVRGLIGNILLFLFQFIIMILFTYSLLRNGKYIRKFLVKIIPLSDDVIDISFKKFNQMNYVTLVCNGLGGILQGGLAGILFWLAGIETVFLWTMIMSVLAFIPIIGMSFIFIPTTIYLLIIGKWGWAIVIFAGCNAISLVVENVYKPKFIGKRLQIDSLLLLFGIIGGLSYFGALGIFYGPIIITMFLTFVQFGEERHLQE